MKRFASMSALAVVVGGLAFSTMAETATAGTKQATEKTAPAAADTLEVIARVVEIPGTFPPNDLYNYVYVMKYRVIKVVKGTYKGQDILIGQYNPLIARKQVKDAMDKNVDGDVQKFEVGAKHKLSLITPIDKVWKDALEDEYFDSDLPKYYAVKTDIAK